MHPPAIAGQSFLTIVAGTCARVAVWLWRTMAQDDAMKAERERQEAATEVWEERNDGVGNKFWVNQKTKQTLLEHPVQRAKRNAMHNAERARMRDPVRDGCLSSCVATHTHVLTCASCVIRTTCLRRRWKCRVFAVVAKKRWLNRSSHSPASMTQAERRLKSRI